MESYYAILEIEESASPEEIIELSVNHDITTT